MVGTTLTALGELVSLQAGVGFPLDLQGRSHGDFPLAKVGDISRVGRSGESVLSTADHYVDERDLQRLKASPIPAGSILFSKIGEAIRQNHRVIAGCPLLIDNNAMAAIPSDRIDSRYLFHFLRTVDFYALVSATTVPALRKSELERLLVPLPRLSEQRRIAQILDKADVLRAKRRAAIAQLDTLTQSILLDMFGDPATNPKGWPAITLGEVTDIVTGYPFRSEEYESHADSIRLCRGVNVLPNRIDWTNLARWPRSKAEGFAEFALEVGDVVIAMDRPWISEGFKIARVQLEDCPALLVQRVARIRGMKETTNAFLFYLLRQPSFTSHCRPTETTIPHISPKDIRSFRFPFPPFPLQDQFSRCVAAIEELEKANCQSLAELDALFASLQHRIFVGCA